MNGLSLRLSHKSCAPLKPMLFLLKSSFLIGEVSPWLSISPSQRHKMASIPRLLPARLRFWRRQCLLLSSWIILLYYESVAYSCLMFFELVSSRPTSWRQRTLRHGASARCSKSKLWEVLQILVFSMNSETDLLLMDCWPGLALAPFTDAEVSLLGCLERVDIIEEPRVF